MNLTEMISPSSHSFKKKKKTSPDEKMKKNPTFLFPLAKRYDPAELFSPITGLGAANCCYNGEVMWLAQGGGSEC